MLSGAVSALALAWPAQTLATPISLVPDSVNMFRDTRGANNVGIGQGDLFQFGADVVGGSTGTRLGALYGPTGFAVASSPCTPLAVSANFCARTTPFAAVRTEQPWTLRFDRANETPLTVAGPSLAGSEAAVPFPVNVTITGAGLTPTISWTVPGDFTADAVRINIFDRQRVLANGQSDVIHSIGVATSLGAYALPALLSSGRALQLGGDYVFNIQLIDTRGDPARFVAGNNNAEILRRSSSFFSFTPLSGNGPPQAALPTVVNGVYNFSVTNVGPDSITFIDPFVAVGYDYATGAGDPNFASVVAPAGIGDGLYDLFLWNGSGFFDSGLDLTGGAQFFFGGAGVSRFSIRGIEASAGLDPANVAAFITGLTFVSNGNFTGTMTPLVLELPDATDVPEPPMAALLLLAGWGLHRFGRPGTGRRTPSAEALRLPAGRTYPI